MTIRLFIKLGVSLFLPAPAFSFFLKRVYILSDVLYNNNVHLLDQGTNVNIFILSENPYEAAWMQCDKHIVKMVTESAQMLSTAHRLLDGEIDPIPSKSGKRILKYRRLDDERENVLMKNVHENHPCTLWTMESISNYYWHYSHYCGLAEEYEYRYGKSHGAFNRDTSIGELLAKTPKNLKSRSITPFALAMGSNPECIYKDDPVQSYRKFYKSKQDRFKMTWTKREVPKWFLEKSS